MSSLFRHHPQEADLVRYLDAEISPRAARRIQQHLDTCGQCRSELQEWKNTFADCARYRQEVLAAQLPAPPLPWRDLYTDFSRIDESLASESLLVRLMRPWVHSGAPKWALAGALAMLVVSGVFYQLRQAPSVHAATLLRQAVAAAEARPRPAHRIQVRTRTQQFTRSAGTWASVNAAQYAAIVALFQAAHYDWSDPLSARAFQAWRDAQPRKTDVVSTVSNPQSPADQYTRIRTVAAEGELASASIMLRNADFTPVEERLEFRDAEWVELSEIADTLTGGSGTAVAESVEVPVRAAEPPSRPAAFTPGSAASISDEIQAISALNEIGADLGDPVDVSLSEGKVLVSIGEGVSPDHQKAIQEKLPLIPHVQLRFLQPDSAAAPPAVADLRATTGNLPPPPIQSRLEKHLGGRQEFERFSTQLLDQDDVAMQHVYALRKLAQKFSPDTEGALSPQDAELLHEMSRKHTAGAAREVTSMEHVLVPTLSSLGGTAAGVAAPIHNTWQAAVEDTFRSSRRVEVLVSEMLGTTPAATSSANLPSELLAALKELQANLDDCGRLIRK